MSLSTYPRRAAAVAVVLLGVLAALVPAYAGYGATAGSGAAQSVTSGTFAVIPTTLATTPPPGPLVLTYPAGLTPGPQYFDAVNTGSIDLVGASYGVALSSALPLGGITLTLTACVGFPWDQAAGTCAGTSVVLGSWTAASAAPVDTGTAPGAPGARLSIRAALSAGLPDAAITATISVSVSSGPTRQIRAARTTNS